MHRSASQRGFTLTEVLMAVGILGVGLTMIASIFPVAVDQSRLSRDQTCAALCARSGAAMLRIRHNDFLTRLRDRGDAFLDASTFLWMDQVLDKELTIYDPQWFLYRSNAPRSYDAAQTWSAAGHYAFRVYSGRVDSGRGTASGPHRVVIAVCKTSGANAENPLYNRTDNAYPLNHYWNTQLATPGSPPPPKSGQYTINVVPKGRVSAYLLDYVSPDRTGYLACGQPYLPYGGGAIIPPTTAGAFRRMAGIIAVYHTYFGE